VPLERLEAIGKRAEQGIILRLGRELDLRPADLRVGCPAGRRPRGLGQELCAEAHAEDGNAVREEVAQQGLLAQEPRVMFLLIHVHGSAEDERGPECIGSGRRRVGRAPFDEIGATGGGNFGEDAGPRVGLVHEGEDPHRLKSHKARPAARGAWRGGHTPGMTPSNVEIVKRGFERLNRRGVDGVLELLHPDFEAVVAAELSPEPDSSRVHERVRRWFAGFEGSPADHAGLDEARAAVEA
jgi:hypothetical protein